MKTTKFTIFLSFLLFFSALFATTELSPEDIEKLTAEGEAQPLNTFRFIGGTIVCKTIPNNNDHYACHRIGNFKINQKLDEPTEPYKVFSQADGSSINVYVIESNQKTQAYWAIGQRVGIIKSIQITGDSPNIEYSFASIKLGDSRETVTKYLGPRYKTLVVDEIDGVMWDYAPFPITIEFINDTVYSIKITSAL